MKYDWRVGDLISESPTAATSIRKALTHVGWSFVLLFRFGFHPLCEVCRNATGHLAGTARLLMTYVENGAQFTREYGDIDERFYSSVESALEELAVLLRGEARELYPQFRDRLAAVEQMTDGIGSGSTSRGWGRVW